MQSTGGAAEDTRIKHYRVKQVAIQSDPQMPVLADGVTLGVGSVTALVHARALTIMAGAADAMMGGQPAAPPPNDGEVVSNG
jgi:diacylglycerol kinase family enzyme